jgi:hypothetical protein
MTFKILNSFLLFFLIQYKHFLFDYYLLIVKELSEASSKCPPLCPYLRSENAVKIVLSPAAFAMIFHRWDSSDINFTKDSWLKILTKKSAK